MHLVLGRAGARGAGRHGAVPDRVDLSAPADLAAAVAHLRAADPRLGELIDRLGVERLGDLRRGRPTDPLAVLQGVIIGQQVSVAGARTTVARLNARYGGRPPTAEELIEDDPEALRAAAGLTRAKTAALRSLAEHALDGSLGLDRLDELSDEEITRRVTAVRGLGPWSAEIFLMLGLGRRDVVAAGDLGLRRAIRDVYGLEAMPPPAAVRARAEAWRPERTLACVVLWRSLELGESLRDSLEVRGGEPLGVRSSAGLVGESLRDSLEVP